MDGGNWSGGSGSGGAVCSLIEDGRRCSRAASSQAFSKRLERIASERSLTISLDPAAAHNSVCSHHKRLLAAASGVGTGSRAKAGRRRQDDVDDDAEPTPKDAVPRVHLELLPNASLRRIKKHFKLQTRAGLNKTQIGDALMANIATAFPVNEKEVLTYFIYSVKTGRNKLHHKLPAHD